MGAAGARTTLVAEDEEFPRGRTRRQRRPKQSCLDLVYFLAGGGHDAPQPIEFFQGGLLKKDGGPCFSGVADSGPLPLIPSQKTPNPKPRRCHVQTGMRGAVGSDGGQQGAEARVWAGSRMGRVDVPRCRSRWC